VLVEPGNAWALARALERLLLSCDLRVALGTRARRTVHEFFRAEATLPALIGLLADYTSRVKRAAEPAADSVAAELAGSAMSCVNV
jgi:hypothetical protein